MNTLEDRLRSELAREGGAVNVSAAPGVDALEAVASGRRRRNRFTGTAAIITMVAGLFVAALFASQPGQVSDVIVSGSEASGSADSAGASLGTEESGTDAVATTVAPEVVPDDQAAVEQESPADDSEVQAERGNSSESVDPGAEGSSVDEVATALQAASNSADVEIRESAVDFAGGSGVFVESTGSGFAGLATRFGTAGSEVIGIASSNGLDWTEVDLGGLPDGAAPVALESFAGTYVAQFEGFVNGARSTWIATSTDLINWQASDPLQGDFVVVQRLLVGANGVVLLGDDVEPDVWSGPIGGPYVRQEQLPTRRIGPASVIDGQFVVLGADADSGTEVIFRSSDGVTWTSEPAEDETIPTGLSASSEAFLSADGEVVSVADVLGLEGPGRFSVVNVDTERALVLVDTENGLTWVAIQR